MIQTGPWKKQLLYIIICITFFTPPILASQEIRLAELNPDKTALGVFRSFKHQILLVSLVQVDPPSFKCLPNQYYLYNYGSEQYVEINAGNLKINSDFTRMFITRVHSLPADQLNTPERQKQVLRMMSKTLKAPENLISAAQQKSRKPNRICWQQPELLDMQNQRIRSFPVLAANLCENQWCSELYWTGPKSIQLWIHSKIKQFQLVNLDVEKGTFSVKSTSHRFKRTSIPQLNAPRENLVSPKTQDGMVLVLKKQTRNSVKLEWHKETSGRIIVSLVRQGSDPGAAEKERARFNQYVKKKSTDKALQSARFALWLDPGNLKIKIDRLKLFVSMSRMNRFFTSLKQDFSSEERFTACQELHPDPAIRHLWKNDKFAQQFKSACSR